MVSSRGNGAALAPASNPKLNAAPVRWHNVRRLAHNASICGASICAHTLASTTFSEQEPADWNRQQSLPRLHADEPKRRTPFDIFLKLLRRQVEQSILILVIVILVRRRSVPAPSDHVAHAAISNRECGGPAQFQPWLKPIISILLRELERMQEPNEERLLASLVKGERALQM